MKTKLLFLSVFFFLFVSKISAQECEAFDELMKQGDKYFYANQPDYKKAINAYTAAWLDCPDSSQVARAKINMVFDKIESLKKQAISDEQIAIEQKQKAEKQKENLLELFKSFLPNNYNKDIYQFYADRADSLYKIGNYTDALSNYKAAELLKNDDNNVAFKLKKALCEDLKIKSDQAYTAFYITQNYTKAANIYAEICEYNPLDNYSKLMYHFSALDYSQYFIAVPSGKFKIGDKFEIEIAEFRLSPYEVTNAQYVRFLNEYKSTKVKEGDYKGETMIDLEGVSAPEKCRIYFENGIYQVQKGYELHPVIYVSWYGADEFSKFYFLRLPSESQWEYAAGYGYKKLEGTDNVERLAYAGTNSEEELQNYAWYNISDGTKQVGLKKPNSLDLYDMSGNVWEWCSSFYMNNYNEEYQKTAENCENCSYRVIRGGSWISFADYCLASYRYDYYPYNSYYYLGFRLVFVP